jgi:hypothetical protein
MLMRDPGVRKVITGDCEWTLTQRGASGLNVFLFDQDFLIFNGD